MSSQDLSPAAIILRRELQNIKKQVSHYCSVGLIENDLFRWRVLIFGQPGTPYQNAMLPGIMEFPPDFPQNPPTFTFRCPMFHPNIHGTTYKVCISILHPPGIDPLNPQETEMERWRPIYTVESIVVAIVSLLNEVNLESPDNIEAARLYKHDRAAYDQRVKECAMNGRNYM
jgi:ubiquitin-conjugating enzyme E2 G1